MSKVFDSLTGSVRDMTAGEQTQFDSDIATTINLIDNNPENWFQGDEGGASSYKRMSPHFALIFNAEYMFSIEKLLSGQINYLRHFDSNGTRLAQVNFGQAGSIYYVDKSTYPTYAYSAVVLQATGMTLEYHRANPLKVQCTLGPVKLPYKDYRATTTYADEISTVQSSKIKLSGSEFRKVKIGSASDWHYNSQETASGYTAEERINIGIDALNKEHEREPYTCVILPGDLCMDTETKRYLPYVLEKLKRLKMLYFVGLGNHENYTDAEWKALVGYNKNFIVEIENGIDLLYIATFNDLNSFTTQYGAATTDISADTLEYMENYLASSKNEHAILWCHYPNTQTNVMKLINNPKVVCICAGHDHNSTYTENYEGTGKTVFRSGHLSTIFSETNPASSRVIEVINGNITTHIIRFDVVYKGTLQYHQLYEQVDKVTIYTDTQGNPDKFSL